jgi:hypothetical protein
MTHRSEEHTVAEIDIESNQSIERKQRNILPWVIGLVLLVLVIWGLSKATNPGKVSAPGRGAAASDTLHDDTLDDKTPPRLRQYA